MAGGVTALERRPIAPDPRLSRRRSLMRIGSVAVSLSLSLFGVGFVVWHGVSHASAEWPHGMSVNVFMSTDASAAQTSEVSGVLRADPNVRSVTYCYQACAYAEFRQMFPNTPEFTGPVQPTIPASFRVVPVDPSRAAEINTRTRNQPGVRDVMYPDGAVFHSLTRVTPAGADLVRSYQDAGATWWLEGVNGFRGSPEQMMQRVKGGPPNS